MKLICGIVEPLLIYVDNSQIRVSVGIRWTLLYKGSEDLLGQIRVAASGVSDRQIQLKVLVDRRVLQQTDYRLISSLGDEGIG